MSICVLQEQTDRRTAAGEEENSWGLQMAIFFFGSVVGDSLCDYGRIAGRPVSRTDIPFLKKHTDRPLAWPQLGRV